MSGEFAQSVIDEHYTEFVTDLFIGFMRAYYNRVDHVKDYKWDSNSDQTKISIDANYRENETEYKPLIVVSRGDVGWANLSFDPYKNVGVKTKVGIDNIETRRMDLVIGNHRIDHYSRVQLESSNLAMITFVLLRVFSKQFKKNGLQNVTSVSIAPAAQHGEFEWVTTVLVKWGVKWEWVYKKIIANLTKMTIILQDVDVIDLKNEIEINFSGS